MGSLIGIIILAAIVYVIVKYGVTPKYRVKMTDPVTGYIRYLRSVDGINNTFNYTSSPEEALIFKDSGRASSFMSTLPKDSNPEIEVHKIVGWKRLNQA